MPIITKAGTPVKGSPTVFTLDKTALAAVASVAADAYYSDNTNWKTVLLYYKSSIGNQQEILKFDATLGSPTSNFLVSLTARDNFEIQQIVIKDFDNGYFRVPRSQLTTAEFDVSFHNYIVWDTIGSDLSLAANGGLIHTTGESSPAWVLACGAFSLTSKATGNFTWEFSCSRSTGIFGRQFVMGIRKTFINSDGYIWNAVNFGLQITNNGEIGIYESGAVTSYLPPNSFTSNVAHVVKFSLLGSTLSVYLDNTLIATILNVSMTEYIPYFAMQSESNSLSKAEVVS